MKFVWNHHSGFPRHILQITC